MNARVVHILPRLGSFCTYLQVHDGKWLPQLPQRLRAFDSLALRGE